MAEQNTAALAAHDQEAIATLTEEELQARREWYRQYRAANPAKVAKWEKARWQKKAREKKQAGTGKRNKKQGAGA